MHQGERGFAETPVTTQHVKALQLVMQLRLERTRLVRYFYCDHVNLIFGFSEFSDFIYGFPFLTAERVKVNFGGGSVFRKAAFEL